MIQLGHIKVTNIDRGAIAALSDTQDLREGLEILGQIGELSAKTNAPVLTGNLRRSITYEVGRGVRGLYLIIGSNLDYAAFQELGTRYHAAQPYLRPALEAIRRALR